MDGNKKQPEANTEQNTSWYHKDGDAPTNNTAAPALAADEKSVEWTASEFIAHPKGFGWYAALVLVAIVVMVLLEVVTHDVFSMVIIAILAVVFGVGAALKPRVLTYRISNTTVTIGEKTLPMSLFKSFTVVSEGAFSYIALTPLKRFALPTVIYYPPKDEGKIMNVLSSHLPLQPAPNSVIDHLVRRIRF